VQQNLQRLAAERMWEVYADHANAKRGYSYVDAKAYPSETEPGGLKGYKRTTTVREVSAGDYISPKKGSGIKRCLVTVTGPDGREMRVEFFVTDIPAAAP
jgi:hypothetical protein